MDSTYFYCSNQSSATCTAPIYNIPELGPFNTIVGCWEFTVTKFILDISTDITWPRLEENVMNPSPNILARLEEQAQPSSQPQSNERTQAQSALPHNQA